MNSIKLELLEDLVDESLDKDFDLCESFMQFRDDLESNDLTDLEKNQDLDVFLSFMCHATGIQIMFDPKFDELYNRIKQNLLNDLINDKIKELDLNSLEEHVDGYLEENESEKNVTDSSRKRSIFKSIINIKFSDEGQDLLVNVENFDQEFQEFRSYLLTDLSSKKNLKKKLLSDLLRKFKTKITRIDLLKDPDEIFVLIRIQNLVEQLIVKSNFDYEYYPSWTYRNLKFKTENLLDEKYGRKETCILNSEFAGYSKIFKNVGDDIFSLVEKRFDLKKMLEDSETSEVSNGLFLAWYFLFGCEFKKNPGSILQIWMFFDLYGQELSEIFKELESSDEELGEHDELEKKIDSILTKIPMHKASSFKDATHLGNVFCDYMPSKYVYNKEDMELKKNELVEREARLVKKWIKRNDSVLYDALKNFDFEAEDEEDKQEFGKICRKLCRLIKKKITTKILKKDLSDKEEEEADELLIKSGEDAKTEESENKEDNSDVIISNENIRSAKSEEPSLVNDDDHGVESKSQQSFNYNESTN